MCDFSGNWIAWMDGELSPEEAARAQRHLDSCGECRNFLDSYRRVTLEFNAFCDERMASNSRRREYRTALVLSAVGAVAMVAALLLITRPGARRGALVPEKQIASLAPALPVADAAPASTVHRAEQRYRRRAPVIPSPNELRHQPDQNENEFARAYEPVIEISIPAEEIFPPGAVPPGMRVAADLSIAPDGFADRVRLQPRLTGFERRTVFP